MLYGWYSWLFVVYFVPCLFGGVRIFSCLVGSSLVLVWLLLVFFLELCVPMWLSFVLGCCVWVLVVCSVVLGFWFWYLMLVVCAACFLSLRMSLFEFLLKLLFSFACGAVFLRLVRSLCSGVCVVASGHVWCR